jgi:hypothetical protein
MVCAKLMIEKYFCQITRCFLSACSERREFWKKSERGRGRNYYWRLSNLSLIGSTCGHGLPDIGDFPQSPLPGVTLEMYISDAAPDIDADLLTSHKLLCSVPRKSRQFDRRIVNL